MRKFDALAVMLAVILMGCLIAQDPTDGVRRSVAVEAVAATFGAAGVVQVNVTVAGGTEETARWVVQNDGKIVIAGPTEH